MLYGDKTDLLADYGAAPVNADNAGNVRVVRKTEWLKFRTIFIGLKINGSSINIRLWVTLRGTFLAAARVNPYGNAPGYAILNTVHMALLTASFIYNCYQIVYKLNINLIRCVECFSFRTI